MLKYKRKARLLKRNKISTGLIVALEIFAVVVGILLGFLVNEWRENRANQKIAEHALESIALEFQFNHRQMVETYEYYSYIISTNR